MQVRMIGLNANGLRVGEDHHGAKLTNRDVELIRQLRGEGMSYSKLAAKFELSRSTVWGICNYLKRSQVAVSWKRAA
jgi:DNA invertase Pin-like site-specific DNA recombinase